MASKQKRLKKEMGDCASDREMTGVNVTPVGDSLEHLKGTLKGPKDTPYEKGVFIVDIQIPANYPFKPPKCKFDTRIWHPNVSSQTGAICLDILGKEWSPALTLKTMLISLQILLGTPVPDDPQDATVAAMYKSDITKYNQTAADWTAKYASPEAAASVPLQNLESALEDSSGQSSSSSSSASSTGNCCIIL